jgi:hypothetical protein
LYERRRANDGAASGLTAVVDRHGAVRVDDIVVNSSQRPLGRLAADDTGVA